MLSLFDFIYLVPIYLAFLSSCRESRVSLSPKMESRTSKEDMMEEKNITLRQFISGCVSIEYNIETIYLWLCFTHHLELEQRMQIGLPDERWTYSGMNAVASVSREHFMIQVLNICSEVLSIL